MATPQRPGRRLPHPEDGHLQLYIRNPDEIRLARGFKRLSRRQLSERCGCSHTLIYKLEHSQQLTTDEAIAQSISRELELDWRAVFSATPTPAVDHSVNGQQNTANLFTEPVQSIDETGL